MFVRTTTSIELMGGPHLLGGGGWWCLWSVARYSYTLDFLLGEWFYKDASSVVIITSEIPFFRPHPQVVTTSSVWRWILSLSYTHNHLCHCYRDYSSIVMLTSQWRTTGNSISSPICLSEHWYAFLLGQVIRDDDFLLQASVRSYTEYYDLLEKDCRFTLSSNASVHCHDFSIWSIA